MILHRARMILSIEALHIRITSPRRWRSQIRTPLLSPLLLLLLLLLLLSLKNPFRLIEPKYRLSFHVQFFAGDVIRGCDNPNDYLLLSQHKEYKDRLAGRQVKEIIISFCNDRNLCNGSSRLAEISTMMTLLPASLALLISFFSRL